MLGSDRVPDLNIDYERAWVGRAKQRLPRERNGALLRAHAELARKLLDTADIVKEAIFRQIIELGSRSDCSLCWDVKQLVPLYR